MNGYPTDIYDPTTYSGIDLYGPDPMEAATALADSLDPADPMGMAAGTMPPPVAAPAATMDMPLLPPFPEPSPQVPYPTAPAPFHAKSINPWTMALIGGIGALSGANGGQVGQVLGSLNGNFQQGQESAYNRQIQQFDRQMKAAQLENQSRDRQDALKQRKAYYEQAYRRTEMTLAKGNYDGAMKSIVWALDHGFDRGTPDQKHYLKGQQDAMDMWGKKMGMEPSSFPPAPTPGVAAPGAPMSAAPTTTAPAAPVAAPTMEDAARIAVEPNPFAPNTTAYKQFEDARQTRLETVRAALTLPVDIATKKAALEHTEFTTQRGKALLPSEINQAHNDTTLQALDMRFKEHRNRIAPKMDAARLRQYDDLHKLAVINPQAALLRLRMLQNQLNYQPTDHELNNAIKRAALADKQNGGAPPEGANNLIATAAEGLYGQDFGPHGCAKAVSTALQSAGVNVSDANAASLERKIQRTKRVVAVSPQDYQPGDIVFVNQKGGSGRHAMMVDAQGRIVGSPGRQGDSRVRVQGLGPGAAVYRIADVKKEAAGTPKANSKLPLYQGGSGTLAAYYQNSLGISPNVPFAEAAKHARWAQANKWINSDGSVADNLTRQQHLYDLNTYWDDLAAKKTAPAVPSTGTKAAPAKNVNDALKSLGY